MYHAIHMLIGPAQHKVEILKILSGRKMPKTVALNSRLFLNDKFLTILPLINSFGMIAAFAATPDAAQCASTSYTGSQKTLLSLGVLSLGLGVLHSMGCCKDSGSLPYISMIQLVNVVGIIVLSIMIAESNSEKSTSSKACSLQDSTAAQEQCKKTLALTKPCNDGRGWVIAALCINILVLLLLSPAMTASAKKYGKGLRGLKVRVTTDSGSSNNDDYGDGENMPMRGEDSMDGEEPMRGDEYGQSPRVRFSPNRLKTKS